MLRRLRRRTGSWRAPALALAAFAAIFTFSTLVIGPAVSGSDTPTDTAVPADTGELLWERLGKGERWVMPVGHELVFAALPVRMVAILDWLEEKTAEPAP